MSWFLDMLGVRGPWESKRDIQRVVGSTGMNLTQLMSSGFEMLSTLMGTPQWSKPLCRAVEGNLGRSSVFLCSQSTSGGSQDALPSRHSRSLSDCPPPAPWGLQTPLENE